MPLSKPNIKGSALLVSLLVMGVLIAISLALSTLILRESRITLDFLNSGKAYYAAESGIEMALYGLEKNLPGWEPSDEDADGYHSYDVKDLNVVGEYAVDNRCKAYPCYENDEFDVASVNDTRVFYDVLDLNESINIPLFIYDEDNGEVPVGHFIVEFYANFDPKVHLNIKPSNASGNIEDWLNGWDVLRWKIFGIRKDNNLAQNFTEALSDFTALSNLNVVEGDSALGEVLGATNSANPSWFGSPVGVLCAEFGDRLTDKINCAPYYYKGGNGQSVKVDPDEFGQVSDLYFGTCAQWQGREFYGYLYKIDGERELDTISGCYNIETFLDTHKLNYLTLTNLINPAVFDPDTVNAVQSEAFGKLYFRVEVFADGAGTGNELVREVADITANGYSGGNKQTINVKVRRGSFMPVFNFSLYSTYGSDSYYLDS
ncbi:pilus assembly PilX N-terminal domain-containing protein [Candidatus Peregrinibacteria bacterium]|nr:pilus assembly PilX N-terminal domain-containing protein [Candidatus Peregrinibacteria bacterium]